MDGSHRPGAGAAPLDPIGPAPGRGRGRAISQDAVAGAGARATLRAAGVATIGRLRGESLFARAARTSGFAAAGHAGSQALRLASNLVLTRLLFPEDFGLMALVAVVLQALTMISDVGLGPAILSSSRGDDPVFLDTAWTVQLARGALLWLAACALASPVAGFYGEPMLAQLLPLAGLTLLIAGFSPTRIETANRHLLIGRVMALEFTAQVVNVLAMIGLAWLTGSVWALAAGVVVGACAKLVLASAFLPGRANRLRWDREAGRHLVHFGKWIVLATVCGFVAMQGDKLFLGKYLTLEQLGIYNIGYFLASAPLALGGAVTGRVLIPLYRERPAARSPENFRKLRTMRVCLTAALLAMLGVLALGGPALVGLLYDERYVVAGPLVTLISCVLILQAVILTYDYAALAAGDTRRFFNLMAARAALFSSLFLIGLETGGLLGAFAGQALATVCFYPLTARLARVYGAWDPLHDVVFGALGLAAAAAAIWLNRSAIVTLAAIGSG